MTDERFAVLHDTPARRPCAGHGPPLPDERAVFLRRGDGGRSVTRRAGERLPGLREYAVVGNGDVGIGILPAAVDAGPPVPVTGPAGPVLAS